MITLATILNIIGLCLMIIALCIQFTGIGMRLSKSYDIFLAERIQFIYNIFCYIIAIIFFIICVVSGGWLPFIIGFLWLWCGVINRG